MNKKILMSLSVIAAAAAAVVGGTGAFFSDTETSTGNTFTAGAIDLKVDSQQSYNGNVCTDVDPSEEGVNYQWVGNAAYPKAGTACTGAWAVMKDLVPTVDKFFDFNDVKPGDNGSNSISLHVINNDAYMCATVSKLVDADNDCTEPEDAADGNCVVGEVNSVDEGELKQNMLVTIWKDIDGDNVLDGGETVLYGPGPVQEGTWPLYTPGTGAITGGSTAWLGVKWDLPLGTGNEAQTDSLRADVSFKVEQARNNPNFSCNPQPPISVDTVTNG